MFLVTLSSLLALEGSALGLEEAGVLLDDAIDTSLFFFFDTIPALFLKVDSPTFAKLSLVDLRFEELPVDDPAETLLLGVVVLDV